MDDFICLVKITAVKKLVWNEVIFVEDMVELDALSAKITELFFNRGIIEKDEVVCSMFVEPFMKNSMGRAHGAAIYALMDHTFAILSNMTHDGTGQSMEVKYYRPASGKLRCVAKPMNISRSLSVYDVKVFSEEDKLVASASCTAFIIRNIE